MLGSTRDTGSLKVWYDLRGDGSVDAVRVSTDADVSDLRAAIMERNKEDARLSGIVPRQLAIYTNKVAFEHRADGHPDHKALRGDKEIGTITGITYDSPLYVNFPDQPQAPGARGPTTAPVQPAAAAFAAVPPYTPEAATAAVAARLLALRLPVTSCWVVDVDVVNVQGARAALAYMAASSRVKGWVKRTASTVVKCHAVAVHPEALYGFLQRVVATWPVDGDDLVGRSIVEEAHQTDDRAEINHTHNKFVCFGVPQSVRTHIAASRWSEEPHEDEGLSIRRSTVSDRLV